MPDESEWKIDPAQEIRDLSWFHEIPRRFFRYPTWVFSSYVGLGYAVAGALHFRIWRASEQVETVFTNFGLAFLPITPIESWLLFIATGLTLALVYHRFLLRVQREGGDLELVFWGTALSGAGAWIPWLFTASLSNTVFLFFFGMIGLGGFSVSGRLMEGHGFMPSRKRADPWKMFANATKAFAAVIAVLLGAIATSVMLPWRNTRVEYPEFFRYGFLCGYLVVGMITFVIMPLFTRALGHGPFEESSLEPPGPI